MNPFLFPAMLKELAELERKDAEQLAAALAVVSATSNVQPITDTALGTAILPATDGAWARLRSNGTSWVTMCRGT